MLLDVEEVDRLSDIPWVPGSRLVHVKKDQTWPDDVYSEEGYHVELNAPMSLVKGRWVLPRGVYAVIDYPESLFAKQVKVRRYVHETSPLFLKTIKTMSKAELG